MSGYSYHWPRGSNQPLRSIAIDCPACGDGQWTITLDLDGNEVGTPSFDCSGSAACERCYVNGQYGDALAEAVEAADKLEAEGPTSRQLESYYDTAGPSADDQLHQMREARRFK